MKLKILHMLILLWGHNWVYASDLSVSDALKQLITKQEATEKQSKGYDSSFATSHENETQRKLERLNNNETLENLIKRTWPGLPAKDIWVKKAFIDINPDAFVNGNPNLLRPGAVLKIPTQAEMRSHYSAQYPGIAALFAGTGAMGAISDAHGETQHPARKGWVRFP